MGTGTWIRTFVTAAAFASFAATVPCHAQELANARQLRERIDADLTHAGSKAADAANDLAGRPRTQAIRCALYHLAWMVDWDNAAARKFLGYEKDKDGWTWRRDDKKRAILAEAVLDEGLVPPDDQRKVIAALAPTTAAAYMKILNVAWKHKAGANKADEADYDDMVDSLAYWARWLDPADEEMHRVAKHPAPWGLYVRPWYVDAMGVRYQHERTLDACASAAAKDVKEEAPSSDDAKIGVRAVAKTPHVVVRSWTSPEHARDAAARLECAWLLLTAEGPAPKPATAWHAHLVSDRDGMEAAVKLRAGADTAKSIQEGRTSAFASFRASDGADHFAACDMAGVPSLERVLARVAHDAAAAAKIHDEWQVEGISDLLVAEVMGRAEQTFAGGPALVDGKPGTWRRNAQQPAPYREGTDFWSKLRWLVACDLDPPFSEVTFKEAREMTRADRMKAAGAVRFLREYWREAKIAPADKRVKDEYASTAAPTFPLWGRSYADFDWQYRAYMRETR